MWLEGAKLLVWFFTAIKMKIFSFEWSKSPIVTLLYSIYTSKIPMWTKMVILNHNMVENIFKIIFILTATKKRTCNFADIPFGPVYSSSTNASLTAPSISTIIQCIFKIFQIIGDFSKIVFFPFLKYSANLIF